MRVGMETCGNDNYESSACQVTLRCCHALLYVQVLLLVWDDQTNNYGMHSGVMATHDQETLNYFKGSKVTCVLCPRQGSDEDSYLQVC